MDSKTAENNSIDMLKDLLIRTEKEQIQRIENRLNDPMIRAKEVARLLPEAIALSALISDKLSRVIQPLIDDSIKASVKNNPRVMAEAIAPALGPGIRRSITATILEMIQSLNQMLNHSFSVQGIKWRFEAFKTRKQFAEIVLLHTLVYQVEQIFLIHRESGIVLDHVVAQGVIIQDPDLVSGMLTAIQDFVKDSFHTETEEDLDTLRMGSDRSVWIERGKHALIAAVIRGNPPLDLRITYREIIEEIHIQSGTALENFDGDASLFSIFREQLKVGLQFQEKKEKKPISPLLWCMILIILSLLCIGGFNTFKTHQIWSRYLNRLETQNGLILLSAQKKYGKYEISGLRDPLAKDPLSLLPDEEKDRLNIISRWKPFHSLDPKFVFQRAQQVLTPPPTITLTLFGNILHAKGTASQDWIETFRKTAPTLPGINGIDERLIQNMDRERLDMALKELVKTRLYFKKNSTTLVNGQEPALSQILQRVKNIQALQSKSKRPVQIIIFGHTDSSGSEAFNQRLSRNRAETIFNHLLIKGVNPAFLTISGVGTNIVFKKAAPMDNGQYNRAVSFKPVYISSTKGS